MHVLHLIIITIRLKIWTLTRLNVKQWINGACFNVDGIYFRLITDVFFLFRHLIPDQQSIHVISVTWKIRWNFFYGEPACVTAEQRNGVSSKALPDFLIRTILDMLCLYIACYELLRNWRLGEKRSVMVMATTVKCIKTLIIKMNQD